MAIKDYNKIKKGRVKYLKSLLIILKNKKLGNQLKFFSIRVKNKTFLRKDFLCY